jgi:phage shock protein PspC (stress-responsive transcriptional regulator)
MKLERVKNGQISGVCDGLGNYFNISGAWFRLAFLISGYLSSSLIPLVVYLILMWAIPEEK